MSEKIFNNKNTILLLSHFNFSEKGLIYGPVHSITAYLRKKNIPYRLIAHPLYSGERSYLEEYSGKRIKTRHLGFNISLPLFLKSFLEILINLYFAGTKKYKCIIGIDPLNSLSAVLLKKIGTTGKIVYYTVDYAEDRFANRFVNFIYHRIDEFSVNNSDFLWSVSKRILDKREEDGVLKERNLYVPNASIYSSVKRLNESLVDRFAVVMVTGKTHSLALPMVLKAFTKVKKIFPQSSLVLIGPYKLDLSNSSKGVRVMGQLPRKDLLDLLRKSGIGLAIYTRDYSWTYFGDSMKAREYLLCGLPVIISDVVSTAEDVLSYDAGVVVKVNENQIAEAMIKILKNEKYWINLRKNAISLAKDFDFEKIIGRAFQKLEETDNFDSCVVVTHGNLRGPAHEIRDYLRSRSKNLMFISHPLLFIKDNYSLSSSYQIYKKEKGIVIRKKAYHWVGPEIILYAKDLIYSVVWVWENFTKVNFFVGSGNLNALAGIILKKLGKVDNVVFYCIDYVPFRFKSPILNYFYHLIDKICALYSDTTWNLSERMIKAREERWGRKFQNQIVVPHGSYISASVLKLVKLENYQKYEIVFAGSLLKKQGVQLAIKILPGILKRFPEAKLKILGGGNYKGDLERMVERMRLKSNVIFMGYLSDRKLQIEISKAHVAIALYTKNHDSFSYYGDPGKIKHYLSLGVPVIITGVPLVASELEEEGCGMVVGYSAKDVGSAVEKFFTDPNLTRKYRENSLNYAMKFGWSDLFKKAMEETIQ